MMTRFALRRRTSSSRTFFSGSKTEGRRDTHGGTIGVRRSLFVRSRPRGIERGREIFSRVRNKMLSSQQHLFFVETSYLTNSLSAAILLIAMLFFSSGRRRRYHSAGRDSGRIHDRRHRLGDLRGSAIAMRRVVPQRQRSHQRTQQSLEDAAKSQGE